MMSSALERNVRRGPRHPHVERLVQKQVRQQGTDDTTLRRSRCPRDDAAVLHLHRRLQPALDVEQHPRTIRMTTVDMIIWELQEVDLFEPLVEFASEVGAIFRAHREIAVP